MAPPSVSVSSVFVTLASLVIVAAGLNAGKVILVPFLLSAFIAILGASPMFWLQRRGLPVWLALTIVMLAVFLAGLLLAGLVGTSVAAFSENLPLYENRLRQLLDTLIAWLDSINIHLSGPALSEAFDPGAVMKLVATLFNAITNMLANGVLVLMTVIFMLLEASGMPAKLRTVLGPSRRFGGFDSFVRNLQHYMAIKTIVSLITGLLVTLVLVVIGVDFPLLWGLLAFLLNYVPNIGSIIAAVPAVLLAMVQLGPWQALFAGLGYLAINLIMGNILEPRFMGHGLGLSPLIVFLSLLFWGWLLGPVGMLLSVPLTITAKIALDSHEDTRWVAVLLGPAVLPNQDAASEKSPPETRHKP
ncbi:AI-2E family transporter [Syntrophotalea acetylenica]|uniref:AI-2E family transporter n=1 Tax=Syntrophotalea TaxID=2812025 RepID=UPI002A36E338|nr:AI-2E family transporter [Syntrophotalea acetylenica]MDY0261654.1 AI-2E family transporter [Syntrophotalea acetylenica]